MDCKGGGKSGVGVLHKKVWRSLEVGCHCLQRGGSYFPLEYDVMG